MGKSDTEEQKEDLQAEALSQQQIFLGGQPLFEDLAEEAESLRSVIAIAKEQNVPENKLDDAEVADALDTDRKLECSILLNHADHAIAGLRCVSGDPP